MKKILAIFLAVSFVISFSPVLEARGGGGKALAQVFGRALSKAMGEKPPENVLTLGEIRRCYRYSLDIEEMQPHLLSEYERLNANVDYLDSLNEKINAQRQYVDVYDQKSVDSYNGILAEFRKLQEQHSLQNLAYDEKGKIEQELIAKSNLLCGGRPYYEKDLAKVENEFSASHVNFTRNKEDSE